jgi:hypothetical protein
MKRTGILAVLLVSGALATPAYANFFHNPYLGVNLNIGSAPNPTPAQIRAFELPTITQDDSATPPVAADAAKPATQPAAPVAQNQTQPASSTPPVSVATESH